MDAVAARFDPVAAEWDSNATGVYHTGFERGDLTAWFTAAGLLDIAVRTAHHMEKGGRAYDVLLVTGRAR